MGEWAPQLSRLGKPRYLAIADAIAEDIRNGKLSPSDRLPPQRKLARRLDIDFTTVARGYIEAQRRGLIESRVGQGTFVRAPAKRRHGPIARHPEIVDLSMNLPPEPDDPELLDRMQDGLEALGRDLVYLMRYQGFGGVQADKDAASHWLRHRMLAPPQDRLFIAPGAHPALLGILGVVAKAGDVLLSEPLTYPGVRSIAAQLGLRHVGLPMDDDGVDAEAFADACKRLSRRGRSISIRRYSIRRRIRSRRRGEPKSLRSPAASASTSSRTILTAFCRSTARRHSRRWLPISPGMSPVSPNASVPGCGSPMS